MDCPKCNGHTTLRVVVTEHRADGTHRWRRCISCKFAQRTLERPYCPNPGPVPGTQLNKPKNQGSSNSNSVLSENDIRRLRQQAADGVPNTQLSRDYGIAPATVSRIINRKLWAHVV